MRTLLIIAVLVIFGIALYQFFQDDTKVQNLKTEFDETKAGNVVDTAVKRAKLPEQWLAE